MREKLFLTHLLAGVLLFAAAVPGRAAPAGIQFAGDGELAVLKPGVKLFSNRPHALAECPDSLLGKNFLRNSIDEPESWVVSTPGILTVLTPQTIPKATSQVNALKSQGFVRAQSPAAFQSFGAKPLDQVWTFQKQVKKGERFQLGKWVIAVDLAEAVQLVDKPWSENAGERLYNGIQLPEIWPSAKVDMTTDDPIPVPYLEHPPEVISIDVGRQLFVDEFLIEETDLLHMYHLPEKYTNNPVLQCETALERQTGIVGGTCRPCIWWNPEKQQFYLWYQAGTYYQGTIALATGTDGLHWTRPALDVLPGSNQALPVGFQPDSYGIVADWEAADPQQRFKLFSTNPGGAKKPAFSFVSADGIHWTNQTSTGGTGDRSSMFYNPFRKKWVYSIRTAYPGRGRSRDYRECDDFLAGASWTGADIVPWLSADRLDAPEPGYKHKTQLYNFDAVAYESVMLGFFELHRGPDNGRCAKMGLPKLNEISFGYSRDGFHFDRPDRRAQIPASRKDTWDRGFVESGGNICAVVGDKLYFYHSGCRGDMGGGSQPEGSIRGGMYDPNAIGVSVLRRDGFASLNAGASKGHITTRPVRFSGKRLFVNADCPQGALRAEILDESGQVIEPFTLANAIPLSADSTLAPLTWKNGADLASLAGRPVRFRFELQRGALYAFWVSRDETGRSDGYVAGGGPGYLGATDTVGLNALLTNTEKR